MEKKRDMNVAILNAMCEQLGVKLPNMNQNDTENIQRTMDMDTDNDF